MERSIFEIEFMTQGFNQPADSFATDINNRIKFIKKKNHDILVKIYPISDGHGRKEVMIQQWL